MGRTWQLSLPEQRLARALEPGQVLQLVPERERAPAPKQQRTTYPRPDARGMRLASLACW